MRVATADLRDLLYCRCFSDNRSRCLAFCFANTATAPRAAALLLRSAPAPAQVVPAKIRNHAVLYALKGPVKHEAETRTPNAGLGRAANSCRAALGLQPPHLECFGRACRSRSRSQGRWCWKAGCPTTTGCQRRVSFGASPLRPEPLCRFTRSSLASCALLLSGGFACAGLWQQWHLGEHEHDELWSPWRPMRVAQALVELH